MPETVTICGTDLVLPDYRVEHWRTNPDWESAHLTSMRDALEPGMIVYDVGAEFGDFTALFAKWVGEQKITTPAYNEDGYGRMVEHHMSGVVPIEPSNWYWPAIRETFELNGLARPLGSFHGFATDETAYDESPRRPWPAAALGVYNGTQGFSNVSERPDLQRVTLDDVARTIRFMPDAITIDVEGAEIRVVLGAQKILRTARPFLWVSVHPEMMRRDWGVTADDFHATVCSFGYEPELLEDSHEEHWAYWPVTP